MGYFGVSSTDVFAIIGIATVLGWGNKQQNEAARRNLPLSAVMQLKRDRDTYLQAFERWYGAFQPLLVESLKEYNTKSTKSAALALEIRWECMNATLSVNHFLGEMDYDNVTERFRNVLVIAHKMIACEDGTSDPTYSSQGALILSVYSVVLKCRDRAIRRAALDILEAKPRREGITDSAFHAKLARLQMEIEEFGIGEHEVIPEENRLRGIKSHPDMLARKGYMKYLKKDKVTGEFGYQQIDFDF